MRQPFAFPHDLINTSKTAAKQLYSYRNRVTEGSIISKVTEKNPTIVVIDESRTSLSLYELSAEPLAAQLVSFASPLEAVSYLEEHDADLVFLDILMRELDGLTLVQKMRDMERHRETPVVMVTSKDYAQDRATATELGVLEFLLKPLRSQEIRDLICKYTGAPAQTG